MRLVGLTLCLLASSLGARAESVEERVGALEARVKALEEALRQQAGTASAVVSNTVAVDGTYKGQLPGGEVFTLELAKGHFFATSSDQTKAGTFEMVGDKLIATVDGKTEYLRVEGDHLKNDKIDLTKLK